jgi:uncharacterized membrane-anchored protein YhcB (DUF1043 family)
MELSAYAVHAALLAAGLAAGFGFGLLRNDRGAKRAKQLAGELEGARKECELARGELVAAREKIAQLEKEHDDYRGLVTDHFVGASDRLREFTVQYRAVYQHLAEGASALCGDRFPGLEASFEAPAPRTLEAPESEADTAAADERDDSGEESPLSR